MPVPVALVGEIGTERLGHCGNGFRGSGDFGEVAEMAAGERDDMNEAPSLLVKSCPYWP